MAKPDWTERKLEFDFSGCVSPVWRPELLDRHLKAPDFVAPYQTETWVIECKDPETAALAGQSGQIKAMIAALKNDALAKEHLLPKIFGVYVYSVMTGAPIKPPVRYATVIGVPALDAALRSSVTNLIQRVIDGIGPLNRATGNAPIAEVHSVQSWNAKYPAMRITRLP